MNENDGLVQLKLTLSTPSSVSFTVNLGSSNITALGKCVDIDY